MPMSVHNKPTARQIQPMALSGRLEAIRAPTNGKTRKSPPPKRAPTVLQELEGCRAGVPDKNKRVNATPATNMVRERPASDQASQEEARELIPRLLDPAPFRLQSQPHSTGLPSPRRHGARYEKEERRRTSQNSQNTPSTHSGE